MGNGIRFKMPEREMMRPLHNRLRAITNCIRLGHVAEWLRSGLQNRLPRFNSGRGLHSLRLFALPVIPFAAPRGGRHFIAFVAQPGADETDYCAMHYDFAAMR